MFSLLLNLNSNEISNLFYLKKKERAETCEIPPSVWPLHLARWRGQLGQWGLSRPGPLLGWQLWRCLRSAGNLQGEEHVTLSLQACNQSQQFAPVGSGQVGGEESGWINSKGKMWCDLPSERRQLALYTLLQTQEDVMGGQGRCLATSMLTDWWLDYILYIDLMLCGFALCVFFLSLTLYNFFLTAIKTSRGEQISQVNAFALAHSMRVTKALVFPNDQLWWV